MGKWARGIIILGCLILILSFGSIEDVQAAGVISRISMAYDTTEANSDSYSSVISGDGNYIVFASFASNLVPNDTNNIADIFLYHRQTHQITLVSKGLGNAPSNVESGYPSLSADGRYVVFQSSASNLVANDTNNISDIFLYDRQTDSISRVSVSSDNEEANNQSAYPTISADGRYVAFESYASNLVPSDTNNTSDIFVHDRQTGNTSLVSVNSNGEQGNNTSGLWSSLSADGQHIAFSSLANNLVANDTNNTWDIFVRDIQTNTTSLISISFGESLWNGGSTNPVISSDGRYVAFQSEDVLVANDTNNTWDVFVYDRQTAQTTLISKAYDQPTTANGISETPFISADGRYVVFSSSATNIVPNDTNGWVDIFQYDRQTAQMTLITTPYDVTIPINGYYDSSTPSISADGTQIAFSSRAYNLVSWDVNNFYDIFLYQPNSAPYDSLNIVHTEITQVIQDEQNNVPLVKAKPTLIRIYPECVGCPPQGISGVSAIISGPGSTIIFPNNRSVRAYPNVDWSSDAVRGNLNRSLNFTLPSDWLWFDDLSISVQLILERPVASGGAVFVDAETYNIHFYEMQNVTISDYKFVSFLFGNPDNSIIDTAYNFLETIFPVGYVNPKPRGDILYSFNPLHEYYTTKAIQLAELFQSPNTYTVSWVNGDTVLAHPSPNKTVMGFYQRNADYVLMRTRTDSEQQLASRALVHELAHASGFWSELTHLTETVDGCGEAERNHTDFPYPTATIQEYGTRYNLTTGSWTLIPPTRYDIMTYCDAISDNEFYRGHAWVSPYTYMLIFNYLVQSPADRVPLPTSVNQLSTIASISTPQNGTPQDVIMVGGNISLTDNGTIDWVTSIHTDTPISISTGTTYCLEAQNSSDVILSNTCFDLAFYEDEFGDLETDSFFLTIPDDPIISKLVLKKGATPLAIRQVSNNTPLVTLTYPVGGEIWTANTDYNITWTASDADNDALTYDVFYNYKGDEWVLLVANLADTQFTVNSGMLGGGTQSRIRIYANDGFHTTIAQSSSFTVPKHTPQMTLEDSSTPVTVLEGETVILQASATDKEDGMLPGNAYMWSSDLDGVLAIGQRLMISSLSVGTHLITVSASDIDNNQVTATRTIIIQARTIPTGTQSLLIPADMVRSIDRIVSFEWDEVAGAFYYQVQVGSDMSFNTLVADELLNTFVYTHQFDLSGEYFWRVRGVNDLGVGEWSETRSLTIEQTGDVAITINEQQLFHALQGHLPDGVMMLLADIQPTSIVMTANFSDNAIATIILAFDSSQELVIAQIDNLTFSQGYSTQHESVIRQELLSSLWSALDDLLGEFIALRTLTLNHNNMVITVEKVVGP